MNVKTDKPKLHDGDSDVKEGKEWKYPEWNGLFN